MKTPEIDKVWFRAWPDAPGRCPPEWHWHDRGDDALIEKGHGEDWFAGKQGPAADHACEILNALQTAVGGVMSDDTGAAETEDEGMNSISLEGWADEIQRRNPGFPRERALEAAAFGKETLDALIGEYGSIEAALEAPGRPWSEVRKELGLDVTKAEEG